MQLQRIKNSILIFVIVLFSCGKETTKLEAQSDKDLSSEIIEKEIIIGANQLEKYLPLLESKRIGIVANQTSVIFKREGHTHLVDSFVSLNVDVKKVYAPEHGFRGTADAGELLKDGVDTKTGIPIVSIYGKNKKPTAEQLSGIDMLVFDIQDVGARFYTYISSLHYVMEACGALGIPIVILDRPNPNGSYIDGPILEMEHQSFVGMHPIPVVHGMTIGEYAKMINGEGWLADNLKCDITIIPVANYKRTMFYHLPIKPSPNLPNDKSINLYPSLCFFEGTNVSAGRGTSLQFQIFGSPKLNPKFYHFTFTPQPNEGAKYPKHRGKMCYGLNLSEEKKLQKINLEWLIEAYNATGDKSVFFIDYFTTLAGTKTLQKQIEQGYTAYEIRNSWRKGIEDFEVKRRPYLIYN